MFHDEPLAALHRVIPAQAGMTPEVKLMPKAVELPVIRFRSW